MRQLRIKNVFAILLLTLTVACKKDPAIDNVRDNESFSEASKELVFRDIPRLIWTAPVQPDPLKIRPAIFYTPHQDDETLGMGASIAEHSRVGRPTYVVLLSKGESDGMLTFLQTLNPNATMQDVIQARNNEFIAACQALGVHRIYISSQGMGFDENVAFENLVFSFRKTMEYMEHQFPGSSHKTISGNNDSYDTHCSKHPTHQAAATGLHQLFDLGMTSDVRLYRDYVYYGPYLRYLGIPISWPNCDPWPSWLKPVNPADYSSRIHAIAEYQYENYAIQRYGLGYHHSVSELFDNSMYSGFEFVDFIDND